jgi:hypothetical protein
LVNRLEFLEHQDGTKESEEQLKTQMHRSSLVIALTQLAESSACHSSLQMQLEEIQARLDAALVEAGERKDQTTPGSSIQA